MRMSERVLLFCFGFCFLFLAPAWAIDPEVIELQDRIDRLEEKLGITLGGALRVNYAYNDWVEEDDEKIGDFAFDTFRLNLDGTLQDLIVSVEYRFYPEYDFNTIHHGWIGYEFTEALSVQVGVHQVPFGLQPFASHNFWFSGAYYLGLEDDYDLGLKVLYNPDPWELSLAFYKNGELGSPSDAGRYSVDPIVEEGQTNEETNQLNARAAYTVTHGEESATEIGLSGQLGQMYNNTTEESGTAWAGAVHLDGNYGRWNLQLEGAMYGHDLKNPPGVDGDILHVGGYSFTWDIPTDAALAIFNLAYALPVQWGPVESLTFYSDNTVIEPDSGRFETIWQNVVGTLISAGPVYTYVDIISAENMAFMGGSMVGPDTSEGRNTRLNINIGYYF